MQSLGFSTRVLFQDLYRVRESLQVLPTAGEIPVIAVQIGVLQDDGLETALCSHLEAFCAACTKEDQDELVETVQRATIALYTLRSLSEEAAERTQWTDSARIRFEDSWTLLCTRIEAIASMVIMDEEDRMMFLSFRGEKRSIRTMPRGKDKRWSKDSSTKNSDETAETLEDMPYDRLRQGSWAYEHHQSSLLASNSKGSTSILKRAFRFKIGRSLGPVPEKDEPVRLAVRNLTGNSWKSRETVYTLPSNYGDKAVSSPRLPLARIDRNGKPEAPASSAKEVALKTNNVNRPPDLFQRGDTKSTDIFAAALRAATSPTPDSKEPGSKDTSLTKPAGTKTLSSFRAATPPATENKLNVKFERRSDGKIVIDEEDAVKIQSLLDPEQLSVSSSSTSHKRQANARQNTATTTTAETQTSLPRLRGGGPQGKKYKHMVKSPSVSSNASTVDLIEQPSPSKAPAFDSKNEKRKLKTEFPPFPSNSIPQPTAATEPASTTTTATTTTALIHLPTPAHSLATAPPSFPPPMLRPSPGPPIPFPHPAPMVFMERRGLVTRAVDLVLDVFDELAGPSGPVCVHGILHSVNHMWCPCCPYIPHNMA